MAASTAALPFNQARKVCPYLLRDLVIDHPNHVWATDVTYIPIARGFVCLVAIMDLAFARDLCLVLFRSRRARQLRNRCCHVVPLFFWRWRS